ncbi:MAG: hypothetical protein PHY56_00015 [Candidatus Omnitrophica bacterium]|nr:hypothetical protein [Candidatus Omnitrophota bacterium]
MKKLLFLFLLLLIPYISFAERVVVVHEHKYIAEKTIIHEETKTNWVNKIEGLDVDIVKTGNTVTINLKADTFTIKVNSFLKIK